MSINSFLSGRYKINYVYFIPQCFSSKASGAEQSLPQAHPQWPGPGQVPEPQSARHPEHLTDQAGRRGIQHVPQLCQGC